MILSLTTSTMVTSIKTYKTFACVIIHGVRSYNKTVLRQWSLLFLYEAAGRLLDVQVRLIWWRFLQRQKSGNPRLYLIKRQTVTKTLIRGILMRGATKCSCWRWRVSECSSKAKDALSNSQNSQHKVACITRVEMMAIINIANYSLASNDWRLAEDLRVCYPEDSSLLATSKYCANLKRLDVTGLCYSTDFINYFRLLVAVLRSCPIEVLNITTSLDFQIQMSDIKAIYQENSILLTRISIVAPLTSTLLQFWGINRFQYSQ